ncbi:MAG TPA: S26 family signal peptidase [Bacteroidales bacterium]|nr:S26 family signal peptidase [Bacteroidales bacterium]
MDKKNESAPDLKNPGDNSIKKRNYIKFAIVAVLYTLWVIWVGSYWLIIGLGVIFDIYVSKKVNWTPWKKRNQKNSTAVEWLDAIIFAVLAVTFINIFFFQNYKIPTPSMEKTLLVGDHLYVTKLKYGPKIPNTPLSFPFAQHTLPMTTSTKSYLEWITLPYKRLAGFTNIKNDDVVVFNFPEGDTVIAEPLDYQAQSYYQWARNYGTLYRNDDINAGRPVKTVHEYYMLGRNYIWNNPDFKIKVRPVDRRDNYIKRCVAIAGDTLKIVDGLVYINGKPQKHFEDMQYKYYVQTDGSLINPKTFEKLGIYKSDADFNSATSTYLIPLTKKNVEAISKLANVKSVVKSGGKPGEYSEYIFPHDSLYKWNEDYFGPLWIPKKGATIKLTSTNLCFYERIINAYEENKLEVKNNVIYINDKAASSYTFKMDYYFMMGDNRHSSADSRFWGFVPEDHIVGAPRFIWLSLDPEKSFPANIRWKRMFTSANKLD